MSIKDKMKPHTKSRKGGKPKIQKKECKNCGFIFSFKKKSKEIFCPNCGERIISPKDTKKESVEVKEEIRQLKKEESKENNEAKKEELPVEIKNIVPITIFTILFIAFYLIGFFDVLSNLLEKLLGDTFDQETTRDFTEPSFLIFLILFIIILSYSYHFLKWVKIKELNKKALLKGRVFHKFLWIKSIIYIVTTITFVITIYWFRINIFITEFFKPFTDDLLELQQAEQFCPSFLFVIIVLLVIAVLRLNTTSINKELEPPKVQPYQPNPAVTAIIVIIVIIITLAILYAVGFFDSLGDLLTLTSDGNGIIIDEPYDEEEWYLYAPRAAYESGSAPYKSGPYTSYEQCQAVNAEYYYGNGQCRQTK